MNYTGTLISGDGRGKELGFPTLNLSIPIHPEKTGVFVVSVLLHEKEYFGLLHLGPRPTFHSNEYRIEIFLFSFHSSVPKGTLVEFTTLQKIREVIEFSSQEKLIAQVKRDAIMGEAYVEKVLLERQMSSATKTK